MTPDTITPAARDMAAKNVANILTKLQAGKVLTANEKAEVGQWLEDAAETEKQPSGVHRAKLNPRQRLFFELQAKGMAAAQAYRQAYGKPDIADQEAANRAYKINRQPAGAAYLASLHQKTDAKTILSVNERLDLLGTAAKTAAKGVPRGPAWGNALSRLIDTYNKTAGDRAQRIELTGAGGGPVTTTATVLTATLSPREKARALREQLAAKAGSPLPPPPAT